MKKRIVLIISILVFTIIIVCTYFTFKKIVPYTLKGEIDFILDNERGMLLLNIDPSSQFLANYKQVYLSCDNNNKYRVGDKLFVYCYPSVAESDPPYISDKWIYRYYKADQ